MPFRKERIRGLLHGYPPPALSCADYIHPSPSRELPLRQSLIKALALDLLQTHEHEMQDEGMCLHFSEDFRLP